MTAQWVQDLQSVLDNEMYDLPPVRRIEPSIYKVPNRLRNLHDEACTPQLISVGPFHNGSQQLQYLEKWKRQCLKYFMAQFGVTWHLLEGFMGREEANVRDSYAEAIQFESDDFKKMILFDASFIIVLFLKNWYESRNISGLAEFLKIEQRMAARIQLDLILLENQLPFPFIEQLYLCGNHQSLCPTFMELTFKYFDCFNTQKLDHNARNVKHFTDLLRRFYLPSRPGRTLSERSKEVQVMLCASELAKRGIKIRPSSIDRGCWLDIKYSNGVLEIPKFNLNDITQICAWNVLALEQCHYRDCAYVTDYFLMLRFLIHSRSDVDLLLREGIIVKRPIGNIMSTLPNDICTNISSWNINKEYHDIYEDLTKFCSKHWYNVLTTTLRKDYFNTPWKGTASIGAIILLLLTLIQTVCSVLQTYKQFQNES